MKPGYKILIGLAIVAVLYNFYSNQKKERENIIKEVESILTDIRREDYFKIQNQLSPNLASVISIEDIKNYTNLLSLSRNFKFKLKNYNKEGELLKIEGIVTDNNKIFPLILNLKENNNTYTILSEKIGGFELKGDNNRNLLLKVNFNQTKK